MYTKATFARQFKSLIESKGLTQRIIADRINTTETTISRYVSGARTPNIETAVELATVLGVSMDTLVGIDTPAPTRMAPDLSILIECYGKASTHHRKILWSVLDCYMTAEQRMVIATVERDEKSEAV